MAGSLAMVSFWILEQEVTKSNSISLSRVGHLAEAANPIEKLC